MKEIKLDTERKCEDLGVIESSGLHRETSTVTYNIVTLTARHCYIIIVRKVHYEGDSKSSRKTAAKFVITMGNFNIKLTYAQNLNNLG